MSAPVALRVGDRVRVCDNEVSAKFVGALGTVEKDKDPFGRYGVRLDAFPRKHRRWVHWFVGEVLHRVGGDNHG